MVTETIPVREKELEVAPVLTVLEVAELIGIPVVIKPWWGSRRQLYERRHKNCGGTVRQVYYHVDRWRCWDCQCWVAAKDIEIVRLKPGRWICPALNVQALKWPMVDGDKVVMWEGRCGCRYGPGQKKRNGSAIHLHSQELKVLDFSTTAMLVRVGVRGHGLKFLIGRDDGHPFVHVVTKRQVTVAEAYDYMVPVPVYNARMHGFDVKRQGDFFFVPREFWGDGRIEACEKEVKPWPSSGRLDDPSWFLNHPYSNAPLQGTRHIAELYISRLPFSLVKGTVTAPDHPPLQLETWHCVIRNIRPAAVNPDNFVDDD